MIDATSIALWALVAYAAARIHGTHRELSELAKRTETERRNARAVVDSDASDDRKNQRLDEAIARTEDDLAKARRLRTSQRTWLLVSLAAMLGLIFG